MAFIPSPMRLYNNRSQRLYLNRSEREQFKEQAHMERQEIRLLCLFLYYTGVRISEALNVRWEHIQFEEGIVSIRSLKKRNKLDIRELPVPNELVNLLMEQHQNNAQARIFKCHRGTALRHIKRVMEHAGITGSHATARGIRHSFGFACAYNGIPITLCQRLMGHSDIKITAIYYNVVGQEELEMVQRLWD